MRQRHSLAIVLLLAAGCGGGERSPQDVAREYVASDDPSKCDDAELRFLERQTHRRGDAAREACRDSVRTTDPPRDVKVRSKKVDGDDAGVLLDADGQEVVVKMRRVDGRWLVAGFG